jgi:hypothetical protein
MMPLSMRMGVQEALHSQQELTETWTNQVRVLGSQLEKMVRLCEDNASAAKSAQRQVVTLQASEFGPDTMAPR